VRRLPLVRGVDSVVHAQPSELRCRVVPSRRDGRLILARIHRRITARDLEVRVRLKGGWEGEKRRDGGRGRAVCGGEGESLSRFEVLLRESKVMLSCQRKSVSKWSSALRNGRRRRVAHRSLHRSFPQTHSIVPSLTSCYATQRSAHRSDASKLLSVLQPPDRSSTVPISRRQTVPE
jgi:hypothetical protein